MKTGEINYIDIVKSHEASNGLTPEYYHYEVIQGRGRYNKVVARDYLRFSDEPTQIAKGGRAVAFIDRVTGALYKAASWSKPAKTRIA
jgi:hypothetical protein